MPRQAVCTELPKAQHRLFPAGGVEDVEGGGHLHCHLHAVSLLLSKHKRSAVTEEADLLHLVVVFCTMADIVLAVSGPYKVSQMSCWALWTC